MDDQKLFAQGVGLVCQPFLQMVPLTQRKIGEPLLHKTGETVLSAVNAEHKSTFKISEIKMGNTLQSVFDQVIVQAFFAFLHQL